MCVSIFIGDCSISRVSKSRALFLLSYGFQFKGIFFFQPVLPFFHALRGGILQKNSMSPPKNKHAVELFKWILEYS